MAGVDSSRLERTPSQVRAAKAGSRLASGATQGSAVAAPRSMALPVPAELALLALIFGAALALRLWKLGEWSFWVDELTSVRTAANQGMASGRLSIGLIDLVVSQLGLSEWSARLGPALVGAFTIPLLYLPTRRLLGAPVALLSSLLLAISPWHIYWSQNARYYTMLLVLYSLGMFLFYAGLERDRPLYFLVFAVLVVLAFKERLFGLFMVPVALSYVVLLKLLPFERPPGLRWFTPASVLAGLVAIGALFYVLIGPAEGFFAFFWGRPLDPTNALRSMREPMVGFPYLVSVPLSLVAAFGAFQLLRARRRSGLLLSLAAAGPVLILVILAPFALVANRYAFMTLPFWTMLGAAGMLQLFCYPGRRLPLVAWTLILGFFALSWLLDPGLVDVYYYFVANRSSAEQYLLLSLALVLIATGLLAARHLMQSRMGKQPSKNRAPASLLLSLIIPFLVIFRLVLADSLYYWQQDGYRYDWKAATAYVEEHRQPDDVIATVIGMAHQQPPASYYSGQEVLGHDSQELNSALEQGRRAWIIASGNQQTLDPLAPWAEPVCQPVQMLDRHEDGKVRTLAVFLCDPAGSYRDD